MKHADTDREAPAVVTRRVARIDVPTGPGRVLRVALESDPDGTPDLVTLSESWIESQRPDPGRTVELPAESLPALRRALDALDPEGET